MTRLLASLFLSMRLATIEYGLSHKPWRLIYRVVGSDSMVYCVADGSRDMQSFSKGAYSEQQAEAVLILRLGSPSGALSAFGDELTPLPFAKMSSISALGSQLRRLTRQMTLPTSSATSSAPLLSIATPTGRPIALLSGPIKPVRISCGRPLGLPFRKGTKTTL